MEIKNFKYSLIIPTRNRQSTAISAIESGLNCNYPDLEIIVTDNSDDSSLKEMLDERGLLPKVIYSKTTSVLSMRDNWERGVELSSGEYLSVIGDDDAVLPDTFLWANVVLSHHNVEVLKSAYAIYKWPDYAFHGMRNFIEVSLDDGFKIVKNPRELLLDAIKYKFNVGTGPGIYYGFVSRKFLDQLRKIRGRYFNDIIPDFDSGYATLMYAKSYIYSNRVLFVAGHSGASNAGSMRATGSMSQAKIKFKEESSVRNNQIFDSIGPSLQTTRTAILSAQIRALPEIRTVLDDRDASIDMYGAWNYIAEEISQGYDGVNFFQQVQELERLAKAWGIEDKVKPPNKKHLGWGILFEQGPRLHIESRIKNAELRTANSPGNKLVVNGNKLRMTGILDAVRYIDATLSQLVRFDNSYVATYANKIISERSENLKERAKLQLVNNNIMEAESILNTALVENSRDPELLALIGKIYLVKNQFKEAANTWARALTFSQNSEYLKNYLICLINLGESLDAKNYLKFCIDTNPAHADFLESMERELF